MNNRKTTAIRARIAPETKQQFVDACGGRRHISTGLREAVLLYIVAKGKPSPEQTEAPAAKVANG